MFRPLLIIVILGVFVQVQSHGPRVALWRCWIFVLFFAPIWMFDASTSLLVDFRSAVAFACLLGFAMKPEEFPQTRLTIADVLLACLIITQIIAQLRVGPFGPLTAPEIIRFWLLPYLMGRFFFHSTNDINKVLPLITKCLVILSIYAIIESVIKVNIVNKILGRTYGVLEAGEGYRMGLKRAQGPLDHPIFFGLMLVLLFPLGLEAMRKAWQKEGPRWWLFVPIAVFGALFGTVSRGPQIASIFTTIVAIFFRFPKWRLTFAILGIVGAITIVTSKDMVMDALSKWAGEKEEEKRMLVINGEEVEYSGTNHRILLFSVYKEPIEKCGLFGFGYHMKGVEIDEELAQRFGSIDCHYLLFMLRYGYLVVFFFLSLGIISLLYLGKIAWNPALPHAGLAGGMFGAIFSVMFVLLSVWFAPDFGYVWLFFVGLASNLHSLPIVQQNTNSLPPKKTKPSKRVILRPKHWVAHAPIRQERNINHD